MVAVHTLACESIKTIPSVRQTTQPLDETQPMIHDGTALPFARDVRNTLVSTLVVANPTLSTTHGIVIVNICRTVFVRARGKRHVKHMFKVVPGQGVTCCVP